jgi:hypothetical protein
MLWEATTWQSGWIIGGCGGISPASSSGITGKGSSVGGRLDSGDVARWFGDAGWMVGRDAM